MKGFVIFIIIFSILLICGIVFVVTCTCTENFCVLATTDTTAIGNQLVVYFGNVASAMQKGKSFHPLIMYSKKKFNIIRNLPRKIDYQKPVFETKPVSFKELFGIVMWRESLLLESIEPVIKKTVMEAIPINIWNSVKIDFDVLIHFRCSDSPFNRINNYEMQRYRWYKKILTLASRHLPISKIVIMNCTHHMSGCDVKFRKCDKGRNKTSCLSYVKLLKNYLISLGYDNVETMCGTVETDFVTMIKAPCLISPGSSMSLMAALVSKNLRFVSKKIDYSRNKLFYIKPDVVPHSAVADYHDVFAVDKMLRE